MKCRHCLVEYHPEAQNVYLGDDQKGAHGVELSECPACGRFNIAHLRGYYNNESRHLIKTEPEAFFWPRAMSREPLHPSVPSSFADDYIEACHVLEISPKASAALSRRCLQHILRECAKVKPSDLSREIQEVLDRGNLPTYIGDSLDAIRTVGNFAAHPVKSTSTGEVVDVEAGEAEWNLDTVEALFDLYFVQPAKIAEKRDALNKKLADAKKPPLKG